MWCSGNKGDGDYRLIDFDFLGDIDGFEDLEEHGGGLVGFGELSPELMVALSDWIKRIALHREEEKKCVQEKEGVDRPVGLIGSILKRLDVLLVVVLVEALHFPGVALLDPSLERGIVLPLEPLQERSFELADTSAAGGRVEAMRLLEGVEAAWDESQICRWASEWIGSEQRAAEK